MVEHLKILGFISLLVLTAIGCGVQSFCRKNNSDDELYANGGAGSFLRGDRYKETFTLSPLHKYYFIISLSLNGDEAPCMNCLLIEMGEMVCYTPR